MISHYDPAVVTQIVRRFGPVGGMETYVWRLSHELCALGIPVRVICETCDPSHDPRISVWQVPPAPVRPRWRAMRIFQKQVEAVLDQDRAGFGLIHSHERCQSHHVTTFHGPPMGYLRQAPWYRRWSRRVREWLIMESEELLAPGVVAICSVSTLIEKELTSCYPELQTKFRHVLWPGTLESGVVRTSIARRLVFVGTEWKRKGLATAIAVFCRLRDQNSATTLTVFGPAMEALPKKWATLPGIHFAGWQAEVPYHEFDVLIHPAQQEPFGMVVTEARASGVACLISTAVGAGELQFKATTCLPRDASVNAWAEAAEILFNEPITVECPWLWSQVAKRYVAEVYRPTLSKITPIGIDRGL